MQILSTSLQGLTTNDIGNLLNATNFKAQGASAFTFGSGSTQRTFIALNNDTAGFQSTSDDIVEITGYSGVLQDLAIWKVL
jgi:serralysin